MVSARTRLLIRRLLVVGTAVLAVSGVAAGAHAAAATAAHPSAPVVTAVSPNRGSTVGLTRVVIDGRRFTSASTVRIGRAPAVQVEVLSAHRIVAWTPPAGHGIKDVVVHTVGGSSPASARAQFTDVHVTTPGSWAVRRGPVVRGAGAYDDVRLTGISCPTTTTCYSIGRVADDYTGNADPGPATSGPRPVIYTRTGSTRRLHSVPLPADANDSAVRFDRLDAIDCTAVRSCAAIGTYEAQDPSGDGGFTTKILLLSLTDTGWTAQTEPLPAAISSAEQFVLNAPPTLSCGAPGACVAGVSVSYSGASAGGPHGLLFRLRDGSWTVSVPVVPSGARVDGVTHVSCASAGFCLAASTGSPHTYLDVLSGSTWTPQTVRAPKGTTQQDYRPVVDAVRCTAVRRCTALLRSTTGHSTMTSFLRLIGSAQTQFPVPVPADQVTPAGGRRGYEVGTDSYATTLSCPSTTTCFAPDVYLARRGSSTATQWVVARLNGASVTVAVMPEPVVTRSTRIVVVDLACPSTSSCVAVGHRGHDDPSAAADTLADGVWKPGSLPTVSGQAMPSQGQFLDLSCPAVGHCVADADFAWDRQPVDGDGHAYSRATALDATLAPRG